MVVWWLDLRSKSFFRQARACPSLLLSARGLFRPMFRPTRRSAVPPALLMLLLLAVLPLAQPVQAAQATPADDDGASSDDGADPVAPLPLPRWAGIPWCGGGECRDEPVCEQGDCIPSCGPNGCQIRNCGGVYLSSCGKLPECGVACDPPTCGEDIDCDVPTCGDGLNCQTRDCGALYLSSCGKLPECGADCDLPECGEGLDCHLPSCGDGLNCQTRDCGALYLSSCGKLPQCGSVCDPPTCDEDIDCDPECSDFIDCEPPGCLQTLDCQIRPCSTASCGKSLDDEEKGCRKGTVWYEGRYQSWCATPAEMMQDAIDDDPVPLLFDENEENSIEGALCCDEDAPSIDLEEVTPETLLYQQPSVDVPGIAAAGVTFGTVHDERRVNAMLPDPAPKGGGFGCAMTTCTVVFVRGYDFFGDGSGYGGWDPMRDWYMENGYERYEMVDIYGSCVGTANPMEHPLGVEAPHEIWFAGHHAEDNTCSPTGTHDRNTDLRHMAYHLAWWMYDTFDNKPVDVVAHSMGGLLVRYALAMIRLGDPEWPPMLNINDAVTLATPHAGTPRVLCTGSTQRENMCAHKGTMKWMKANAQNPQGSAATDWTLIAADEDNVVSEESGVGMTAAHRLWYNKNCCSMDDAAYDHNDYYKDGSDAMDATYYWQNAGDPWKRSPGGPHSVKRAWWGSISAGH